MKVKQESQDAYEVFRPIMKDFGVKVSPKDFYWAVNEAFHFVESKIYTKIHQEMYEEEEKVWKRLFKYLPDNPKRLSFLDIGCGTGLVGDFVEKFCANRIKKMTLLDPSAQMIEQVKAASKLWKFPMEFHQGDIYSLISSKNFNVISINSVLHHVVDLREFLKKVQTHLKKNGILLTAQDPNSTVDDTLFKRKGIVNERKKRKTPWLLRAKQCMGPVLKKIFGITRFSALAQATNEILLTRGIISWPMSQEIIWAVTDIQVPNQPYGLGNGISIFEMKEWMDEMQFVKSFNYNFHGVSFSNLSANEKNNEMKWWNDEDPHGSEIATVWKRNP